MIDIRSFLPAEGEFLCELKGGPWDKMAIRFDLDHLPEEIVLDGHSYCRDLQRRGPDDDIYFRFQGKTEARTQ